MNTTLIVSYALQAAGALFTAALFGAFSRTYRKPFLLHWARSWSAMCIMFVAAALNAATLGPTSSPPRLIISVVGAVSAYLLIAWLLFGSAELARPERAVRMAQRRLWIFGAAVVLGVLSATLFAWDPAVFGQRARFILRVGVRSAFIGAAFLTAATAIVRARNVVTGWSLGRIIVAAGLALYGATHLHLTWGVLFLPGSVVATTYTTFSGFLAFVLMFGIGLGVVIWLLEDEHARATAIASEVQALAFHDPLTGLPTRKLLLDHLSLAIPQARRDRAQLGLFFIDLDRFKNINDSLGHSAGDKLLQAVAGRIKGALREADTVARMGGDEFVVLTPDIHGVDDAVHVAQKLRDAIREPVQIEGRELFVSASMGIALYPNDGEMAETLLKNADTAMYRAKAQGADLFQLYTPEMNAHAVEQLALENALRRAVETKEFELHYQPIVRMADQHITSLEVMLRWRHPLMGLMRPSQFIRLAESTGLIVAVGEWALRTACARLRGWREVGHPDLRIAVNISARQLRQPDFVDRVRVIVAEEGLPFAAIEMEISEMTAMQSEPVIVDRLRVLREMGIRVSIDDFGTGFSSVSALRHFPVDALKIDTSFVRDLILDPNDATIAAAVVALAKSMGLQVIAEGVENPAQLEFLREQGCEMWQGYLCCPPVTEGEVRAALGRRSGGAPRIPTPEPFGAVRPA